MNHCKGVLFKYERLGPKVNADTSNTRIFRLVIKGLAFQPASDFSLSFTLICNLKYTILFLAASYSHFECGLVENANQNKKQDR